MATKTDSGRVGIGANGPAPAAAPPGAGRRQESPGRISTATDVIGVVLDTMEGVLGDSVPHAKADRVFRGAEAAFRGAEVRDQYGDDLRERRGG